jgi:hypothetical protein
MTSITADEPPVRVRIPADLNAPDRVVAGLTARQVAILAVAAVPVYLAWQQLAGRIPVPVLAGATAPIAAVAVGLALGRRDGLGLDAWLLASLAHRRRPRRLLSGRRRPSPSFRRGTAAGSGCSGCRRPRSPRTARSSPGRGLRSRWWLRPR